jgi:hypothetical protein
MAEQRLSRVIEHLKRLREPDSPPPCEEPPEKKQKAASKRLSVAERDRLAAYVVNMVRKSNNQRFILDFPRRLVGQVLTILFTDDTCGTYTKSLQTSDTVRVTAGVKDKEPGTGSDFEFMTGHNGSGIRIEIDWLDLREGQKETVTHLRRVIEEHITTLTPYKLARRAYLVDPESWHWDAHNRHHADEHVDGRTHTAIYQDTLEAWRVLGPLPDTFEKDVKAAITYLDEGDFHDCDLTDEVSDDEKDKK